MNARKTRTDLLVMFSGIGLVCICIAQLALLGENGALPASASGCSSTVSSITASSTAQTRASNMGFSVTSVSSISQKTADEMWTDERIDLLEDSTCVWWVVMAGSMTQTEHPPYPSGTATPAPVSYVKMSVAVDDVTGSVVAVRVRGTQVNSTHTPRPTSTSGNTPTPTDTPAPYPTPTS